MTTEIIIDIEDSKLLSSLHSMVVDLNNILITCEKALEMTDSHEDQILIDAIGTASVIKYMRCFHSGKRSSLSVKDLSSFTEEELEVHQYIKALRDKHVAHSVSEYEQHQIKANLEYDGKKRLPFRHLLPSSQRVMLSKKNIWALQQLVKKVLDILHKKIVVEETHLIEKMNELPEEEVLKFKKYTKPEINIGINFLIKPRKQKA